MILQQKLFMCAYAYGVVVFSFRLRFVYFFCVFIHSFSNDVAISSCEFEKYLLFIGFSPVLAIWPFSSVEQLFRDSFFYVPCCLCFARFFTVHRLGSRWFCVCVCVCAFSCAVIRVHDHIPFMHFHSTLCECVLCILYIKRSNLCIITVLPLALIVFYSFAIQFVLFPHFHSKNTKYIIAYQVLLLFM